MILVGAVLMSLRPHQIGTHDRLTAAKEALISCPNRHEQFARSGRKVPNNRDGNSRSTPSAGFPEGLAARQREETAVRPTYSIRYMSGSCLHYIRRYEWNTA